jgi:two-component system response regulator AtoC
VIELAIVMSNHDTIQPEDITFNEFGTAQDFLLLEKTLEEYNRSIIQHFLDKYDHNVLLVARKLDIGKSTIYRMIQNGELSTK